jgi:hypothetical protein
MWELSTPFFSSSLERRLSFWLPWRIIRDHRETRNKLGAEVSVNIRGMLRNLLLLCLHWFVAFVWTILFWHNLLLLFSFHLSGCFPCVPFLSNVVCLKLLHNI